MPGGAHCALHLHLPLLARGEGSGAPERNPNWWQRRRWFTKAGIIFGGFMLFIIVVSAISSDSRSEPAEPALPTATPTPNMSRVDCANDYQCGPRRWGTRTKVMCEMYAKDSAIYGWDEDLESVLIPVIKADYGPELVTSATGKLQNAFGAWGKNGYLCAYDPIGERVTYFQWDR